MKRFWLAVLCGLFSCTAFARQGGEPLQFRITEGLVENAFYQEGPVAAHLLLSSGARPRVLVAFPAGNSGVGVWFDDVARPVQWTLGSVRGAKADDAQGRPLHGIVVEASVVAAQPLVVKDAVLGSVRVLRDYQLAQPYPPETAATAQATEHVVTWSRTRLDGAPGYEIRLELEDGRIAGGHGAPLMLVPARPGEPLRMRITALSGEKPLTPFAPEALLNKHAGADERSRNALRFLSYQEKFLAGSWRFDTYFGRDTLMSLRLLMPALRPGAIEDGLVAVLERMNADGEVAHEEDIGEFAVLRHRKEGVAAGQAPDRPIYDYKMIDDDVMLAPVAATYLLDTVEGRSRAAAFLARKTTGGETIGAALMRNFAFVVGSAQAFAREPVAANLIALMPGQKVGQWRDSEDGLAGGRYAYDVNAVFVPAALRDIARLQRANLLAPYLDKTRQPLFAGRSVEASAAVWERHAPPLFDVSMDAAQAREDVARYAREQGIDPAAALASLPRTVLRFHALSLDAQGRPIPVLHSDDGFALLFGRPSAAELDVTVETMLRPFPAGLLTGIGLLVANPAYADADIAQRFGRTAYHGTVVWSWQQALLAAGLERQLRRGDLPEATRARLREAQRRLWDAIEATRMLRTSELWSWSYADGQYRMKPFGQGNGDADESNAAQLWSTVYLAVDPP